MKEINLICIGCPMGCPLTVEMEENKVVRVNGNTCKRGDSYARSEDLGRQSISTVGMLSGIYIAVAMTEGRAEVRRKFVVR